MYLRFWKGVFGCSEKGWRVKIFEDFRCWNEINYGWSKSAFLFCVFLDLSVFVLCNCFFCVIMFVFWLILCSLEIVSRHFAAKNEIMGFRVAKLQNSDVEECDLTFCYIDIFD